MEVVKKLARMRAVAEEMRRGGKTIGLVPTMGALHDGHLSLIRKSCQRADATIASIFVNPTQFGEGEDLEAYPRDILKDSDLLVKEHVEVVFTPSAAEVFPEGFKTFVEVKELSRSLEGEIRQQHFSGVATVVLKLFNIVRPDIAVFGWKDAQQAAIIEQMVRDLNLSVEILRAPTIRDPDGLAMSSRNRYLEPEDRKAATCIYKALSAGRDLFRAGENGTDEIRRAVQEMLEAEPGIRDVDYVAAVDPYTLKEVRKIRDKPILLATAVRVADTRLIDNVVLEPKEKE